MGRIRNTIRKYAKKAFDSSNEKTQEALGKLFPNHKIQITQNAESLRKGVPTKFNPPTKSKRTKRRKR